ncbi:MAG TPA: M23 family metallopeptidase [bacterium]|nr:M23 family metallopeptidase [bacterium]
MKYFIVSLLMTILLLYAGLDHQIKTVGALELERAELKIHLSSYAHIINILGDWRIANTPPDNPPYSWPVEPTEYKKLTSYYGQRNNPLRANTGGSDFKNHAAVDMTGIEGAQVLSVAAGIVLETWPERGWHNGTWYRGHASFNGYARVLHDDGKIAHYGHISNILVSKGVRVRAGQPIARINPVADKHSTGPHLDFRLEAVSGEYVNPLLWIGIKKDGE